MEIIFAIAVLVLMYFVFSLKSSNSKLKSENAGSDIQWARPWFIEKGLDPTKAKFSTYTDSKLVEVSGAHVVIGITESVDGELVGFAIEVVSGKGVVKGIELRPYGKATWHAMAAQNAVINGVSLIDEIQKI